MHIQARLSSDKAAVVDPSNHWIDATINPPPTGAKLLCINRTTGVAVISVWSNDYQFSHWAPMPTFHK